MSEALVPHNVTFYEDEIIAVQRDDAIYVLFSRMCENIGRPRVTETKRAQQHSVLNAGMVDLTIQTSGGPQKLLCLRLDLLPLWLANIPSRLLKHPVQDKVVRYQREAAQVLWQAFKPQILGEDQTTELATSTDAELTQLAQIADMGRAIVRMAEEQIELRRRMDAAARAFQGMRKDITDVQVRLGVLEDKLSPAAYISEAEAAEVSSQVKALAQLLTAQDASKNHYQSIFGEIYRRYGVSSYKMIRREQYESVVAFLEEWRKSVGEA